MIQSGLWQERTIEQLTALFQSDESIRALILTGSCAQGREAMDAWSDVDLVMVTSEGAVQRYFASTDWLAPLGPVFATDRSSKDSWVTLRVCLKDMRRLDFGITTESALQQADGLRRLTRGNYRVLFSRSAIVDAVLDQEIGPVSAPLLTPEQFRALTNQFWFKGTLAVTKVARNDLLIGLHLALDMVRDCCVLAMVLRDRSVGTDHHRRGGPYNDVARAFLGASSNSYTANRILDIIEQSSTMFEHLAREWSVDYTEQRHPLIEWITYTRQSQSGRLD